MNKVIIAFCEGQHDIALLSKLLFANEFQKYDKKIKDFIKPFDKLFFSELSKKEISDKKLGFESDYKVPSVVLIKNSSTFVFFHNLNGWERASERLEVLNMYKKLLSDGDDFSPKDIEFTFLYFFDADSAGISSRLNVLNSELSLSLPIEHNKIKLIDSFNWGCHIFHKSETEQYGAIEDLLIGMMRINNEDLFNKCEQFISAAMLPRERQCEYLCHTDSYKSDNKFNQQKSIISVAGQLQFSSMSNAVIIAKSDYIKKNDMAENIHCQRIMSLFD